jgi:hypothetical protein
VLEAEQELTEDKTTKGQRLLAIVKKPIVRVGLTLAILTYAGFAVINILVVIYLLYLLGQSVGIPTLQLATSAVSAISASASATAALLIWRGNVQSRKTVLIDRVLGPAYAELRHSREILQSWISDASDIALSTPFLTKVSSDWMYYTLKEDLRAELERFQELPTNLDQQKALARSAATDILRDAVTETFQLPKRNSMYLWASRVWSEDRPTGESGRAPVFELVVDSNPLKAPQGYYIHTVQLVDTDNQTLKFFPLLSKDKAPLNRETFRKFWETARKKANEDSAIMAFRETRDQAQARATELEKKLDSEIKRSQ